MCGSIVEDVVDTVTSVAIDSAQTVIDSVSDIPVVGDAIEKIADTNPGDFVSSVAENVADIGVDLMGGPMAAVTGAADKVSEILGEAAGGEGLTGDKNIMSGIDEAIGPSAIDGAFGDIFGAIEKSGEDLKGVEDVVDVIGNVVETINDAVETISKSISEGARQDQGSDALDNLPQNIGDLLANLPGAGGDIDLTTMTPHATEFVQF